MLLGDAWQGALIGAVAAVVVGLIYGLIKKVSGKGGGGDNIDGKGDMS